MLIKQGRALDAYIEAVGQCPSFDEGNRLAAILPAIDELSDDQAGALVAAFNDNHEVYHSFGCNGAKPLRFGNGLLHHLKRTNDRAYKEGRTGKNGANTSGLTHYLSNSQNNSATAWRSRRVRPRCLLT